MNNCTWCQSIAQLIQTSINCEQRSHHYCISIGFFKCFFFKDLYFGKSINSDGFNLLDNLKQCYGNLRFYFKCSQFFKLYRNSLFVYILNNMFLISWKNSKSLPDGIIYEGVSTKPLKVCIILHINSGEFAGMSADIRIGGNDTSL